MGSRENVNSLATLDKILWEAFKSGVACIGCKCGQCLSFYFFCTRLWSILLRVLALGTIEMEASAGSWRISSIQRVFSVALTGPTGQPSDRPKPLSFLLFSVSWKAGYYFFLNFPSLGLRKITVYQGEHFGLEKCFSKIGGNFCFFKKVELLEFFAFTLSFRRFQAKFFFNFSDW